MPLTAEEERRFQELNARSQGTQGAQGGQQGQQQGGIGSTLQTLLPQLGTSLASSLEGRGVQPIDLAPKQPNSVDRLTQLVATGEIKRLQEDQQKQRLRQERTEAEAREAQRGQPQPILQGTGQVQDTLNQALQPGQTQTTQPTAPGVAPDRIAVQKTLPSRKFDKDIGDFVDVPAEFDVIANPQAEAERELSEFNAKNKAEAEGVSAEAATETMRVADTIAQAAGRLADQWAKAHDEEGVGDIFRATTSKVGLFVGGKFGDKFKETGALPGLETEILLRMMPMMTRQGEKEGSVRLVNNVFQRLSKTLPKTNTGPGTARRQLATTINNMFGFARAFQNSGVSSAVVEKMSESELRTFADRLEVSLATLTPTPQEQALIEDVINKALAPIDEILSQQGQEQGGDELSRVREEIAQLQQELQGTQ